MYGGGGRLQYRVCLSHKVGLSNKTHLFYRCFATSTAVWIYIIRTHVNAGYLNSSMLGLPQAFACVSVILALFMDILIIAD